MQKLFSWLKKLTLVALFFLCHNIHAQSFTLHGTITDKDTGTVVLNYVNANNKICSDTASIKQGKFQFNGTVAGADHALLITDPFWLDDDKTTWKNIFIEPGVVNIAFRYDEMNNAQITGSNLQELSEAVLKVKYDSKEYKETRLISSSMDSIRLLLKSGSIDPGLADQKMQDLRKRSAPIWQVLYNTDLSYIRSHPDSYVSLMLLKYLISYIPDDSIDISYSKLSEEVKNSSLGFGFLEYYSRYKKLIGNDFPFDKIKMNEIAPIFTLYNTATDSITLDAFKGSVVLLEFWELTCLPCLQANPHIEKLRGQYSEKEFKVIAITSSSVRELPKLNAYITKNKLSQWIHVSTSGEFRSIKNEVVHGDFSHYYRLGVPRTILIDKSGKVIFKNVDYSVEEMQRLAFLVKKAVSEDNR
jgi:peroxiredoxin